LRLPFQVPTATGRPFDAGGFGLNSIDLVTVVERHPQPNSKGRLVQFERLPGGQIATAMTACARLGWRAFYVGAFGSDELGQFGRQSLIAEGVDVSRAQVIEGATNQFAVVLVNAGNGDRTVLWHRHPALSMMPITPAAVTGSRVFVVDCHETAAAAQAAVHARAAGAITIVDVEKVRPGISDLLRHIDAIIAAESFPSALTGYEPPGRALAALAAEFRAPLVAMTLGEEGSLALCGGREIRTAAYRVPCVDTTGAGDAFRGGFAAACLKMPEGEVEDVLAYANAVAALNCRALGARGGLPTAEEVDRLLIG
jgi:sugar/nucleoside kinase (ribokinase family)